MDLTTLIPQFGGALWTVIFFVVALSVIIAVHEYGHFIVGKKTGIFPEVFSLGFGPVLWSRVDRDGTVWQLAAIPFGGYVKFRGDANASGGVDEDAIEGDVLSIVLLCQRTGRHDEREGRCGSDGS